VLDHLPTDGEHQGADQLARGVHILSGPLRILRRQQFGLIQVHAGILAKQ
jgi:hypothetical protein